MQQHPCLNKEEALLHPLLLASLERLASFLRQEETEAEELCTLIIQLEAQKRKESALSNELIC